MNQQKKNSGVFITMEGGEGAGKSTQIKQLMQWLTEKGKDVLVTREPGGSKHAEAIRALVVEGATDKWLPISELLLYLAARYDHVERLIKPALAEGKYVICDRFMDSTLAYQGAGHGLDTELIGTLHRLVTPLEPDVTFILDIPVEQGLARAKARAGGEDRYERLSTAFHERVRQGFLAIAKNAPKRCVVIDAAQPIESIAADIRKVIGEQYGCR